jgi:hypothetical protein
MATHTVPQPVPGDATDQLCRLAADMNSTMENFSEATRAIETVTTKSISATADHTEEMQLTQRAIAVNNGLLKTLATKVDDLISAINNQTRALQRN